MDELHGRRVRRLLARPSEAPVEHPETAESVLPELPRVGALDALLREVDSLRLTLETDLTLAASAVEAGAPQVAVDIIDSEREGLHGFEQRALVHLADLAAPKKRRRVKIPAAPFVAAAAVAGFLIGVVPTTHPLDDPSMTVSSLTGSTEALVRLQEATESGETAVAIDAANDLHDQLRDLMATAATDPAAAAGALALLQQEQATLVLNGGSSLAVKHLLAESQRLSTLLQSALDARIKAKVGPTATLPAVPTVPTRRPEPTSSPTTRPSPSSSPKPKATPSTSNPSPSSTSGPLPGAPGFE